MWAKNFTKCPAGHLLPLNLSIIETLRLNSVTFRTYALTES